MSNLPIIVSDASAIINLNATECAAEILRCIPEKVVVVDIVQAELEEGRPKGRKDADKLNELILTGLVEVVSLGETGDALFERLVVGPAISTVDDGEAATIAYAVENTLGVVIDDAKARRICRQQFPSIAQSYSVEIFQKPSIIASLGKDRFMQVVTSALKVARMRVPPEHLEWIVSVIGKDSAQECPSLPKRRVHR